MFRLLAATWIFDHRIGFHVVPAGLRWQEFFASPCWSFWRENVRERERENVIRVCLFLARVLLKSPGCAEGEESNRHGFLSLSGMLGAQIQRTSPLPSMRTSSTPRLRAGAMLSARRAVAAELQSAFSLQGVLREHASSHRALGEALACSSGNHHGPQQC